MKNKISCIYKITCLKNNKFYIGSTIDINIRLNGHTRLLRKNKHFNPYLQRAWNKYGEQNFKYEIIEIVNDIKNLSIREQWWLDNTQCYKRKIGFNVSCDSYNLNAGRKFINLTGQKFGRLTPIKYIGKNKWGNFLWLCKCSCDKEKIISGNSLQTGNTKSCGCFREEGNSLKHGHCVNYKYSKTYESWHNMIQRCNNKNCSNKEITVCDKWLPENNGFINFLSDMGEKPNNKTLVRIDNNKLINNYSPKNYKWGTNKEQNRNRKDNCLITFNNKTQLLIEWAEELKIKYSTLYTRIYTRGWSIIKAFTIPVGKYKGKNLNEK